MSSLVLHCALADNLHHFLGFRQAMIRTKLIAFAFFRPEDPSRLARHRLLPNDHFCYDGFSCFYLLCSWKVRGRILEASARTMSDSHSSFGFLNYAAGVVLGIVKRAVDVGIGLIPTILQIRVTLYQDSITNKRSRSEDGIHMLRVVTYSSITCYLSSCRSFDCSEDDRHPRHVK